MNTVRAFTALAALAGSSAYAQLSSLPPPSSADLVPVQSIGANAGATHWENPTGLGAYRVASDVTVPLPTAPGGWGFTAPSAVTTALGAINTQGGTVRAIFTGETAGWLNDFGYTYTSTPMAPGSDSYTVFSNIQAVSPANVAFGDYVDVRLLPGDASTFDFWLNGTDSFTPANPLPPTANGGLYTVFNPANSSPYIAPGNVRWAQQPLMVNTWITATSSYANVSTYLVAVEDWRLDRQSDADYSDFIFALQFFNNQGLPFGDVPNTPVPEPSTYGLIGAISLLGLAVWRRRKAAAAK